MDDDADVSGIHVGRAREQEDDHCDHSKTNGDDVNQ
jgi:hypothetical protein